MIEALVDVQDSTKKTLQGILGQLMEQGAVDALLVPMLQITGNVAPMLVTDLEALEQADPLAPVLPINAARAASYLTMTGHDHKLGVVMRSCEIRALVELVKFQQAKLDNVVIVGIDCLGTYSVVDWQESGNKQFVVDGLLEGAVSGDLVALSGHGLPRRLPDVRTAAARGGARGADHRLGGCGGRPSVPQGKGGRGRSVGADGQRCACRAGGRRPEASHSP